MLELEVSNLFMKTVEIILFAPSNQTLRQPALLSETKATPNIMIITYPIQSLTDGKGCKCPTNS